MRAESLDGAEFPDLCTSLRKLRNAKNPSSRRLHALADQFTALNAEFMAVPLRKARTRAQRRGAVKKVGFWCVAREALENDGQSEKPEVADMRLWEGKFSMEQTGADCTSTYDGEVLAGENGSDAVALVLPLRGSVACPIAAYTYEEYGDARLVGTFRRGRFRLRIEPLDPTNPAFTGPGLATACFQNEIVLTASPAGVATSRYEFNPPSGDVYTCGWDLECDPTDCKSSKQAKNGSRGP
ncbi:MAG TPA: hypothetical protein VFF40_14045 [Acidimicrobiia bacterium]|nr:hypothetical protein [Acidimicrobiia bacterium]